jgi:hypothetical protein
MPMKQSKPAFVSVVQISLVNDHRAQSSKASNVLPSVRLALSVFFVL